MPTAAARSASVSPMFDYLLCSVNQPLANASEVMIRNVCEKKRHPLT